MSWYPLIHRAISYFQGSGSINWKSCTVLKALALIIVCLICGDSQFETGLKGA